MAKKRYLTPEERDAIKHPETAHLLPCPWCCTYPVIRPWHGGPVTRRAIFCENEDCEVAPGTSGDGISEAAKNWNTRAGVQFKTIGVTVQ